MSRRHKLTGTRPFVQQLVHAWKFRTYWHFGIGDAMKWKKKPTALQALCEGKPPSTRTSHQLGPVVQSFDTFFIVSLTKLLNKL